MVLGNNFDIQPLSHSAYLLLQLPSRTQLEREENGSRWEWRQERRDDGELSTTYLLLHPKKADAALVGFSDPFTTNSLDYSNNMAALTLF